MRLPDSQKNSYHLESERKTDSVHELTMSERKKAKITGVKEVISFDSNEILLDTTKGILAFQGENLHVKRLTLEKGEVDLEGDIDELKYSNLHSAKSAGSFFGKLFQ
jgi:sporulation protein YabP